MSDLSTQPDLSSPPIIAPVENAPEQPDFADRTILGTSARTANPMVNAWAALTEEEFAPDPLFSRARHLELLNDPEFTVPPVFNSALVRARSEDEFRYLYGKVREQILDRQFMDAQGAAGFAAEFGMGLASPTIILPAGAAGSIGARVLQGAALAATGEAIDEFVIRTNQEGGTGTQFATQVAAGAVLGGMLGPFVGRAKVDPIEFADDISGTPKLYYATPFSPPGTFGNLGSKDALAVPDVAKSALGLGTVFGGFNPVNRALFQKIDQFEGSAVYNEAQRQLGHGGLILRGADEGRTSTGGLGTVEGRINTYNSFAYKGIRHVQTGYNEYFKSLGKIPSGSKTVNSVRARLGGAGLSYPDFEREVFRALSLGDTHEVPAIAQTAARLRKDVYDPIYQLGKDAGIFDDIEDLKLDLSYVTRNWDAEKVARTVDLEDRFTRDFVNKLEQKAFSKIDKFKKASQKLISDGAEGAADKIRNMSVKVAREIEDLGATNVDVATGNYDFARHARDAARDTIKVMTTNTSVPANLAVLRSERGAMLARVLDVKSEDYLDVLDTNLESNLVHYAQTMGADIELTARFGDRTGEGIKSRAANELAQKRDAIKASKLSDSAKERKLLRLQQQFDALEKDHEVQIARLRRMHGVPDGTNKLNGYARTGRHVAAASSLGGAGISSFADIAGAILENGMLDSFRFGLVPMVRNWNASRINKETARAGGLAIDSWLHTRSNKLLDDIAVYQAMSGAERLAEGAARRVIQLSGLNLVTDFSQSFNASIFINRTFRDIDTVVNGSGKQKTKALNRLARNEINELAARRYWKEMNGVDGGGGKVNGAWAVNIEEWSDANRRSFLAQMNSLGNTTTVVPGLEVPNWIGSGEMARIFGQFLSFMMSANNKIMIRAAQKRDANMLQGVVSMVLVGMFSDWIKAGVFGRYDDYSEMSLEEKVVRGIAASGVPGIFSLPLDVATSRNKPYAVRSIATPALIGKGTQAVGSAANLLTDVISPDEDIAEADLQNMLRTIPGSNLPFLAWAFAGLQDALTDATGATPKER